MKIIRPITLTDAMMTASNVPETDGTAGEWAVGTPYTDGQTVRVTTAGVHKIYECLTNVTGGSSPEADVLAAVPKWLFVSATNRWKAFDQKVGSQTTNATSITYTITPGQVFDSIAFLGLDAVSVHVVITNPGEGVVYDQTADLQTTVISGASSALDWYTYFFSSIFRITDCAFFDLPPYLSAVMNITIAYAGETAKVGSIVFGIQSNLGKTLYNPTIGIHDYSIKEADQWGVYSVIERAFSKRMSCDVIIPFESIADVQNLLASYRATPLVWIGADDFSPMIAYGFYKDFSIVIPYLIYAICSIEIEAMT